MVSQWFPSNWSHHAWGLGKSVRTVNRNCDANLTDQSPAVLVSLGPWIKFCDVGWSNTWNAERHPSQQPTRMDIWTLKRKAD
jgi:hypothetical protein